MCPFVSCCLFHDCLTECLSVLTLVAVCDRVEIYTVENMMRHEKESIWRLSARLLLLWSPQNQGDPKALRSPSLRRSLRSGKAVEREAAHCGWSAAVHRRPSRARLRPQLGPLRRTMRGAPPTVAA